MPLGVDTPTLQSPGVWPLKSELIGEEWDPIEAPPASGHKNYPSADMFRDEIRATFVEEISLAMVIGPCTRAEAAAHCHCTEEELYPCPMAGIDESDKIRSIFDGSKGGANLRIQQNTFQCLHWLRTARPRGDPGALGPEPWGLWTQVLGRRLGTTARRMAPEIVGLPALGTPASAPAGLGSSRASLRNGFFLKPMSPRHTGSLRFFSENGAIRLPSLGMNGGLTL